jgi:hypothetical protein
VNEIPFLVLTRLIFDWIISNPAISEKRNSSQKKKGVYFFRIHDWSLLTHVSTRSKPNQKDIFQRWKNNNVTMLMRPIKTVKLDRLSANQRQ